MDQDYKAKWRQAEADLKALCQSNSDHVQSLASKLHETNVEHQELRTAHERQLRLEAQALREAQQQEQQTAQMTQEHEYAIQELRRQAEEQPAIQKLLWKRQLSQQSTYKAEIHELYTEMLNMREKSEMQSRLAANMCKLEHSVPSRSVESEPENVLNTRSPGRCSRWILPEELENLRCDMFQYLHSLSRSYGYWEMPPLHQQGRRVSKELLSIMVSPPIRGKVVTLFSGDLADRI